MVINRQELVEKIRKCLPGLQGESFEGSELITFTKEGSMFSNNNQFFIQSPVDYVGLVGSVNGKDLFSALAKMTSDELSVEPKEKHWEIKCGKSKIKVNLVDVEGLPKVEIKDEAWMKADDELITALKFCTMQNNNSSLKGILLHNQSVISSDGNYMNKYTIKSDLPKTLVPEKAVAEICKLSDIAEIQADGSWIHIKCKDGTIFSARTMSDYNYPVEQLERILLQSLPDKALMSGTFPEELFSAIDRASVFSKNVNDFSLVKLTFTKEGIIVDSDRSSGSYSESVEWGEASINGEFEPVSIFVDSPIMQAIGQRASSFHLIKATNIGNKETYRILFSTENSSHLFSTISNPEV